MSFYFNGAINPPEVVVNQVATPPTINSISSSGLLTYGTFNEVNASGGAVTLDLPPVIGTGPDIGIMKMDSSTNLVVIQTLDSSLINGTSGQALTNQYQYVKLTSDGTQWVMTSVAPPDVRMVDTRSYAIGNNSLNSAAGATDDIAIGDHALSSSSESGTGGNIAIGTSTMVGGDLSGIGGSVAIGYQAMMGGANGGTSVAVGKQAMLTNGAGGDHVAIGYFALSSMTALSTSDGHVAMGYSALSGVTTAVSGLVGIGLNAGKNITTGPSTIAIGQSAGNGLTTSGLNVIIGHQAVFASTTAQEAVAIGYQSQTLSGVLASNTVALGYRAKTTAQYGMAIGNQASSTAAGAVAFGVDHLGSAATTATIDEIKLGTANHTLNISTTSAVGTGAATNLTALAAPGGPASDQVVSWIPVRNGLAAGFFPFFQ